MTFDELLENLVYSASISTLRNDRGAPDALAWAAGRLRMRYGEAAFRSLRQMRLAPK